MKPGGRRIRRQNPSGDSAKTYSRRLTVVALGCMLLGVAVIIRAGTIQIAQDKRLERLATRQFQSKLLIRPRRGPIVDRNGESLAVNVEVNSLAADPSKVRDPGRYARLISKAIGGSSARLSKRLKSKRSFVWMHRHLRDEQVARLKKLKFMDARGDLPDGFWLVREIKRVYPHGDVASQVIGTVNIDSEGIEGTELWMNEKLRGEVVSLDAYKDALGRPTFIDAVAARHVRDGLPVELTLDAPLQFAVEKELRAAAEKTRSRAGSALVMNADTGEILSMANYPGYDPNRKRGGVASRRNRIITDGFEPGSTIKPLVAALAVSNSGMSIMDRIYGEKGRIKVQGKTITEAEAHEQFEMISLAEMIQFSSNVVAAKLALKLGPRKVVEGLASLGFASRTGLGFPGEISGWMAPPGKLKPLQLATIGFGQGMMATRIQVARAYAAILNGGLLVEPTLISRDGPPPKGRRVLSPQAAADVRVALMLAASDEGTGKKARYGDYLIAGKTGTAQVVDPKTRSYSSKDYIASFAGFALDVEPKVVILVTLDHPRGSYYASETAAPLFRQVFREVASRFNMPAPVVVGKTTPEKLLNDRIARTAAAVKVDLPEAFSPAAVLAEIVAEEAKAETGPKDMPALVGLSAREAIRRLGAGGFKLEMEGFGVVVSQKPDPGQPVTRNTVVRVRLSEKTGLR